jgi:ABC-type glycerol-3-phosphate transport system substrate-binding protein
MKESDGGASGGRPPFSRRGFLAAALGASNALLATGALAALPGDGRARAAPRAGDLLVAQAKPFAGKTIRYQQRDSGAENFVRNVFAPRFEEETGCRVVLEDIPQAELFAKVQIMAAAGQIGDLVFGFDNPWLASWGTRGVLRPIDDFIQAEGFALEEYYPAAVEALTVDGKVFGLPSAGHPGVVNLYFNRKMLADAGIRQPDERFPEESWTWDTVLEAARATTRDTNGDGRPDVWGFLPSKFNGVWAYVHTRQFGGDVMTPDGRTATIGDEKGQAAYRYLHDLTYRHRVAPTPADIPAGPAHSTEKIAGSNFATGQVAMFEDATILITTMQNYVKDFEWGVFPMPVGPGGSRGATMFLNTTSITSASREPEIAWEFLKLICGHEAGSRKLLMNSGSPGVRPDVFLDPEVTRAFPWFQVGHKVMLEARPSWRPHNFRSAEVASAIIQVEGKIWLDDVTPEAGALEMQREIQRILDEPA